MLGLLRANPRLARVVATPPSAFGAVLPRLPDSCSDRDALHQIPSETTRAEREFLYSFYSTMWDGKKNVLEVGPFLGGTTRAIALGMLANPRKLESAVLQTVDRFGEYYGISQLVSYVEPLFEKGLLGPADRDVIGRSTSFLELFRRIHDGTPYHSLLRVEDNPLPATSEELLDRGAGAFFSPSPTDMYSSVFVDGCKSWYSTVFLLRQIGNRLTPGSHLVFQDYGWFTCFWVPLVVHLLAEYLNLVCYVDATYCFTLRCPIPVDAIDSLLPDRAEDLPCEEGVAAFRRLHAQAIERKDERAEVMSCLHEAAFLAYTGLPDRAREAIQDCADEFRGSSWDSTIRQAMQAPTYRPDGEAVHLGP